MAADAALLIILVGIAAEKFYPQHLADGLLGSVVALLVAHRNELGVDTIFAVRAAPVEHVPELLSCSRLHL